MAGWNPNPNGNGGFRDHPEHAFKPTSARMAVLGKDGGLKSGHIRRQQADARFLVRAKQAILDIRADLSPEDVAALARVMRLAYHAGIDRGYARGRHQRRRDSALVSETPLDA